MKALLRFTPAIIAALALGALLLRVNVDAVRVAIVHGHVMAIFPWAVMYATGSMALQSNWDRLLFAHTPSPPRYASVWAGKVGTAVLNAVGYALGSGGYLVWIARATGVGMTGATALYVIAMMADLSALALIVLFAALLVQSGVPKPLVAGAMVSFVAVVAFAIGLRLLLARTRLLSGTRLRRLATATAHVTLKVWGMQILGRSLSMCSSIVAMSFAALSFGLDIPAVALCTLVPASMLVQVLPVNVAGFGAAQVAFVALFASYEDQARLLAFHLLWQLVLNVCFVLRGLPFVKSATTAIANAPANAVSAHSPSI